MTVGGRRRQVETGLAAVEPHSQADDATMTIGDVLRRNLVPGCSAAVLHGGEIDWAAGYGSATTRHAGPVTPETIFQAASISKAVAAVGALRLVEAGLLDLDADINEFLKTWQVPANGDWQPRITLRQLLMHSAALSYCWFPGYLPGRLTPTTLQTLNGEPPANTAAVRVVGIPGLTYRYSGSHYAIVQQVMQDVTGRPFPDLMRELVLEQAGMRRSSYDQSFPLRHDGGVAIGHDLSSEPVAGSWRVLPEMAGAGLWTTPTDLLRLAMAIVAPGGSDQSPLLSMSMVDEMLTPGLGSRGLGWEVKHFDGLAWFNHGGSNIGYRCRVVASADGANGAAIMTNGDEGSIVVRDIMRSIAREYAWPSGAGETGDAHEPRSATPTVDPGSIEETAGTYRSGTGQYLTLKVAGGEPYIVAEGQPAVRLSRGAGGFLVAEGTSATVSIERNGEGAATLVLHQLDMETRFIRDEVEVGHGRGDT